MQKKNKISIFARKGSRTMNLPEFKQWAIVELMGHVRIAGLVTEEERFGAKLGRVEIPNGAEFVTQYFNGASLYRLTPTTEELARAVAASNQPEPVHRWELPQLNPAPSRGGSVPCRGR